MFWEEGSHIVRGLLVPWMGLIIGLSPFRLYQNIWLYFCTTKLFWGNWLIAIVVSCATALSWFGLSRKVAELPWESYSNRFKVIYCFCHLPNWIFLFSQLFNLFDYFLGLQKHIIFVEFSTMEWVDIGILLVFADSYFSFMSIEMPSPATNMWHCLDGETY